jgi:hypothetical protein
MTPALGCVFGIEAEVDQRVVALAGFHDHVAAPATITTRRTAARNKFLATEGHTPIATASGFDSNHRFINEHCYLLIVQSVAGMLPLTAKAPRRAGLLLSVLRQLCLPAISAMRFSMSALERTSVCVAMYQLLPHISRTALERSP